MIATDLSPEQLVELNPRVIGPFDTEDIKRRALIVQESLLRFMYDDEVRPTREYFWLPNNWHCSRRSGAVWIQDKRNPQEGSEEDIL
jgi:hypothetical protein